MALIDGTKTNRAIPQLTPTEGAMLDASRVVVGDAAQREVLLNTQLRSIPQIAAAVPQPAISAIAKQLASAAMTTPAIDIVNAGLRAALEAQPKSTVEQVVRALEEVAAKQSPFEIMRYMDSLHSDPNHTNLSREEAEFIVMYRMSRIQTNPSGRAPGVYFAVGRNDISDAQYKAAVRVIAGPAAEGVAVFPIRRSDD